MPQFPNPEEITPNRARPIPGIVEQQLASWLEGWMKILGITLYNHEHEGLASFIGAILRAYPKVGQWWNNPELVTPYIEKLMQLWKSKQ